MDVRVDLVRHRLRRPLVTAWGTLYERELVHLTITGRDGVTGRGEAAPLEPYDGVPTAVVHEAIEAYAEILRDGGDDLRGTQLLDACREIADLPQALAAVDLAMWDRAGRREGRPLAELLTDDPLEEVVVNATIGAEDRRGAASAAVEAADAGYACVKVKVGIGDDAGRLAAVRAAVGPEMALRIDANGAWDVEDAVRWIERLAPVGLELVEEPVHGLDALRAVRERVPVRIAMDETTAEPGALASRSADAMCLKLSRAGGVSALVAQASLVRAMGAEPYLASTFDGPLGIAAAVHCAAALKIELPCGLATLGIFEDVDEGVLAVRHGAIRVPTGPGLGV